MDVPRGATQVFSSSIGFGTPLGGRVSERAICAWENNTEIII